MFLDFTDCHKIVVNSRSRNTAQLSSFKKPQESKESRYKMLIYHFLLINYSNNGCGLVLKKSNLCMQASHLLQRID